MIASLSVSAAILRRVSTVAVDHHASVEAICLQLAVQIQMKGVSKVWCIVMAPDQPLARPVPEAIYVTLRYKCESR